MPWGWARLVRLWFRLFSRLRRLPRCAVSLLCSSPGVSVVLFLPKINTCCSCPAHSRSWSPAPLVNKHLSFHACLLWGERVEMDRTRSYTFTFLYLSTSRHACARAAAGPSNSCISLRRGASPCASNAPPVLLLLFSCSAPSLLFSPCVSVTFVYIPSNLILQ